MTMKGSFFLCSTTRAQSETDEMKKTEGTYFFLKKKKRFSSLSCSSHFVRAAAETCRTKMRWTDVLIYVIALLLLGVAVSSDATASSSSTTDSASSSTRAGDGDSTIFTDPKSGEAPPRDIPHRTPSSGGDGDAKDSSSTAPPGVVAMQAELDAMEEVLTGAKTAVRELEKLIDAQTLKLRALRALAAEPGVSCDEAVRATERLTAAILAAPSGRSAAFYHLGGSHGERGGGGGLHHTAGVGNRRAFLDDDAAVAAGLINSGGGGHGGEGKYSYNDGGGGGGGDYGAGGLMSSSFARNLYADKTVAKRRETWPDHLQLISAVKVDGQVTALAIMPQRGENDLARYFAVGDDAGKVYVFRPDGDIAAVSDSGTNSSVTALGALLVRRNETIVTSGHANGDVVFHRISESVHADDDGVAGISHDDLHTLSAEINARQSILRASPAAAAGLEARARGRAKGVGGDRSGASASAGDAAAAAAAAADGGNGGGGGLVATDIGGTPPYITAVEAYRIQQKRFIAVADSTGTVAVYKESGSKLHAVFRATSPVAAFKQSTHSVAWLTDDGVGAADPNTLEIRTVGCQHLNGTSMSHARFDVSVSSKFYAVTLDGEIVTGFVNVDSAKLGCSIRNRRGLTLDPESTVATIKGYAFVASGYDVAVFNTTAAGRKPPRDVMTTPLPHLAAMFGHHLGEDTRGPALVVSNRGRLVLVAFPDGLVASYESDLPLWRPEPINTKLWSQPLFVVSVVLIAVWQFYRQKGVHSGYGGGGGGRGGRRPPGFDPAMFENFAKGEGGAGKGYDAMGGLGKYGEKAMKRPGYSDFDPAKFRAEMKSKGKWDK